MDDDFDRELTEDDEVFWQIMSFISINEDDPNFNEAYWVERGMQVVRELMVKMTPIEPAPTASEYAWW